MVTTYTTDTMRLLTRFAVLIATFTTVTNAFKASFTNYGAGDSFGSGSCTQNVGACGHNDPGFTAAISQQQFGVGPGAGAGPACGTCYELTLQTDFAGAKVPSKTITVMIDNLCPIDGNPLCK
ncbi:MAG: hypothetical protein M1828_007141 [Chrysothrix sp. TS-e1954]|nr:MAG: hypothetical protein M1828_007141 [Chrysothrix sp. TS-e1954]